MVEWFHWVAFLSFLAIVLFIDLGILNRDAHGIPIKEALLWTGLWVVLAAGFGLLLWTWQGGEAAAQFAAGYLIEWSLSIDNVFVFVLLFTTFAVPAAYQHRVLFWGVLGAIVLRLGFIIGGAALLHRFEWMVFVFGGILLFTAVRFLRENEARVKVEESRLLRVVRRVLPLTESFHGPALTTRVRGRLMATPLLAVLVMIEATDVVFAVDSVPAVFSITSSAFIAFTSNAMAILGLRSLYFVLAGAVGRFAYLKPALATILAFVGVKIILSRWVDIPIVLSLGVIAVVLIIGIGVSILAARADRSSTGRP